MTSQTFTTILSTLEDVSHLASLELLHADGSRAGVIENKPGSQGSLKLYHHLWKKFGHIDAAAAKEGLTLYAEHTQDAQEHPGKHPNIDRLINVIADGETLAVRLT